MPSIQKSSYSGINAQTLIGEISQSSLVPYELDLAFVLNDASRLQQANDWLEYLSRINRRGLFSLSHDSSEPVSKHLRENAVITRTSMTRGFEYIREYSMPVFLEEGEFKNWSPIEYDREARVGFMGHAAPELHHSVITARSADDVKDYGYEPGRGSGVLQTPVNIGLILRSQAIRALEATPAIRTAFEVRSAHYPLIQSRITNGRSTFLKNVRSNHYTLCIRGSGNFSIRLYETMASGRIPILLDTNQVLPLDGLLDWQELAVMVPLRDLERIGEHVIAFHSRHTVKSFVERQVLIRQTWERFFQRTSFTQRFVQGLLQGRQSG